MSINYPTSLDTTTELPTNRADSTPSATNHAEDHNDLALAVMALEAKVGIDNSSVATSLDSKVRAGGLDARAYGTLTAASSGAAATNTATIEAAIAAAAASAIKTVLIPGGKYYVDDLQIDQAVTVRGHGMHLTTLAYTSTTGYGVTMTHAYAEMSDLKILYEGSGNASSGGHMLWENGRRLESISFEGADVTKKAYRYINHNGDPSAGWRWVGCVFGNSLSAVVDVGVHLDQLGSWPMPGDGIITDCQFLDVVYAVPAMRIKGHPSLRILNPKFLGWSVGVLIDWSNSLGSSNGFYLTGGSIEGFSAAGVRVARSSGSYTLVDNLITGVEFVPGDYSGAACVDIQDGSAPGWTITGNMFMPVFSSSSQYGVKLGSGATKVGISANFFRNAGTGVYVNSGASSVFVGADNYFLDCTTDVNDSGGVIAPVKVYNDANIAGYLNVGSLSAPTNTANGDITADQIYVPKLIGSKTDASGGGLTITTTDHATKGTITFGTSKYDEANNRLGIGMTPTVPLDVTGRTILQATDSLQALTVQGTITTSTNAQGQVMVVNGTIDGSGANPAAFRLGTTFSPTASDGSLFGLRLTPMYAPTTGVTLTTVYGSLAQVQTGSGAGAITNLTCYYAGKVLGSVIPSGTITGLTIDDMGAAGVTTAIGITITKPTNATNNAYFSFNTADATAAGTYAGRLAVLVAGNLRYFHYYNA